MLNRIFFLCLFAALYGAGSSLRCRGMKENFRRFSNKSLGLIDTMAAEVSAVTSGTNDTDDFPDELYREAYSASTEHKLRFAVRVLEEVALLLNHRSAPWHTITVEHFRIAVTRQAEALHPCIGKNRIPHKKLHMYFKRLSHHILERMGHSAESWELIRTEIKTHLQRLDLLLSPILSAN